MAWYAKPSGGYTITSTEGNANIIEMNGFFNDKGYTLESQAGIIANCYHESALNPWRWQSDSVSYSAGYGLFQFTPAQGYFDLRGQGILGYAPNESVTAVTPGANPSDGWAQLIVLDDDILGKWTTRCWRPYWSDYEASYGWMRDVILSTYGNGTSLTFEQFKNIAEGTGGYALNQAITFATFAFLACYEGPLIPNIDVRSQTALDVYGILSGDTPPEPPEPVPGFSQHTMPFYLYFI